MTIISAVCMTDQSCQGIWSDDRWYTEYWDEGTEQDVGAEDLRTPAQVLQTERIAVWTWP